jgi:diguanylate cyclase (GGDEF)-like protein/PAS domain S-box-containing protein
MMSVTDDDYERLKHELKLVRAVADTVPATIAYCDSDQRYRYANKAYEVWLGVKPETLIGKTMAEVLGSIYELNRPHILGALRGEPQSFDREIPGPNGGAPRFSHATYIPEIIDGVVVGFFVHVADLTQRKRLEDDLRAAKEAAENLATHDFLTGLPNRLLLTDRVGRAIKIAGRNKTPVGILFIDLDGFKGVNDRLGHATGDDLLVQVGRRLQSSLRDSDTVARLGGDEFVVLLPTLSTQHDIEIVANTVLENLAKEPFVAQGRPLDVTISIGASVFPEDGGSVDALLAAADGALRDAKRAGKNRWALPRRVDAEVV